MEFISTGNNGLDKMLGGGLPAHKISLVYGEAATGKTVLSMQCALEAAREECKVYYVDSDQSFSTNRLFQLDGSADLAERVILFSPESFEEQSRIVENIESLLSTTPALLVIDSVTGLYRSSQNKSGGFFARDRELNRQVAQLHAIAARFQLWVLMTGQVHSSPSGGQWLVEPVAERTLRHWSDLILKLVQTPRPNVRECFLEKKNGTDVSIVHSPFRISSNGIEDA